MPTTLQKIVNILIVEPDHEVAHNLRATLRAAGVTNPVVVAEDGAAALKVCGDGAPQVAVLVNPTLPDMSGYLLIEELLAKAAVNAVVVIADSDDEDEVHRAFAAGASGYVERPLESRKVLRVLTDAGLGVALVAERAAVESPSTSRPTRASSA
jgi:DNA-binding response OmpR family regulator